MMSLSIEAQTTDKNTIFAIVEGETFASGSTVTFDDITLTFGEAGGPDFLPAKADLLNSDFSAYTPGNNVNGNKAGGTFYVFKPQKAGEITIGVKQNRNKALYIEEDGVVMTQFNGITLTEEQPDSYLFTVAVKAGSTYKLYCAGSKLGLYGFIFKTGENSQEPADTFETAAEAVKNMKVGYCLSNTLDAFADSWIGETHSWQEYETVWGNPITKPEFMKMIRKAGFNAVRVSVTWFPHMDVDGKIDEAWMKRVHEVVDYVIDQGMYCILNSHHDTSHKDAWLWADDSYYLIQEQYRGLWSQIATEFKDYDEHLLFAGWNEILERQEIFGGESYKDRYKVLNQINQDFVDAVRSSGGNNIFRNLVVGPYYNWSVYEGDETPQHYIDSFLSLTIPNDVKPGHILFEVHMYFKTNDSDVNKVINRTIEDANTYLASKKVPIVIGEWGPANEYDNPSIVDAFAHYFMEQTRANNMVSFAWTGPLSYGEYRNLPAFEDPSYIRAIMKGYYGDDYEPVLITKEDYDDKGQRKQFVHTVGFDNIWAELNIFSDDIPLKVKNYKGIRVEFAEPINVDDFVIKVYADNGAVEEGRTPNSSTSATILFSDFNVNDVINRVTLQYCKKNKADVKVIGAWLIRQDDTEEYSDLSPFWGCEITNKENYVTGISTIKHSLKVGSPQAIYNLNGQRISEPRKGINIIDGKKVIK